MYKIVFKDDGQDVLVWIMDGNGVVQACDMQEYAWAGTEVMGAMGDTIEIKNITDIKPGDSLAIKHKYIGKFIHQVERFSKLKMKCISCRFLSDAKVFQEGDYPSVRCTKGIWDKNIRGKKIDQWYALGSARLNRGPVKKFGASCEIGVPKHPSVNL